MGTRDLGRRVRQALPHQLKDLLRPAVLRSIHGARLARALVARDPDREGLVVVVGMVAAPPQQVFERLADPERLAALVSSAPGRLEPVEIDSPIAISAPIRIGTATGGSLRLTLLPSRFGCLVQAVARLEQSGWAMARRRARLRRELADGLASFAAGFGEQGGALILRRIDRASAARWTRRVVSVYSAAFAQPPYSNERQDEVRAFRERFEWYSRQRGFAMVVLSSADGELAGFITGRSTDADAPDLAVLRDQLTPAQASAWAGRSLFFAHELGVLPALQQRALGLVLFEALLSAPAGRLGLLLFRSDMPSLHEWYGQLGWQPIAEVKPQPDSPPHTLATRELPQPTTHDWLG